MGIDGYKKSESESGNLDSLSEHFPGRTLRSVLSSGLSSMPDYPWKPGRCRGCPSGSVCKGLSSFGLFQGRFFSHDMAISDLYEPLPERDSYEQTQDTSSSKPGVFGRSSKERVSRKNGSSSHDQTGFAPLRRENAAHGNLLFRGWNGAGRDSEAGAFERSNREETPENICEQSQQGSGRSEK